MRATVAGLLIGVTLTWILTGASTVSPNAFAERFQGSDQTGAMRDDLIAVSGAVVEGQQLIVLIDPRQRTLGSYHVDARSGQISLRSVRNIRWDLELEEFNGTEPSPEKIQALLRSR